MVEDKRFRGTRFPEPSSVARRLLARLAETGPPETRVRTSGKTRGGSARLYPAPISRKSKGPAIAGPFHPVPDQKVKSQVRVSVVGGVAPRSNSHSSPRVRLSMIGTEAMTL